MGFEVLDMGNHLKRRTAFKWYIKYSSSEQYAQYSLQKFVNIPHLLHELHQSILFYQKKEDKDCQRGQILHCWADEWM